MILDGLAVMAHHYVGAFAGVGCGFDVDEKRHSGSILDIVALVAVLGAWLIVGGRPLQVAAVFVLGCATWARALLARPDRVIEWRAYSALGGVALAAATIPVPVCVAVGCVWALIAGIRAWTCRSELAFRRQAAIESPMKVTAQGNYAVALGEVGDLGGAARIYWRILAEGTWTEQQTAAVNLAAVLRVVRGASLHRGRYA